MNRLTKNIIASLGILALCNPVMMEVKGGERLYQTNNSTYSVLSSSNLHFQTIPYSLVSPFLINEHSTASPTLQSAQRLLNQTSKQKQLYLHEEQENITDETKPVEQDLIGFDPETMKRALEIISSSTNIEEMQYLELYSLGFNDHQIEQLSVMVQMNPLELSQEKEPFLIMRNICLGMITLLIFLLIPYKKKS